MQAASSQAAVVTNQSRLGRTLRSLGTWVEGSATPVVTTHPVDRQTDDDAPPASPVRRTTSNGLEDDSVTDERAAIDGGDASGQLVLKHLRKVYGGAGGKVAVRDLCLRIQTGECFGFLGVNGAGKSTTFSMLTGATPPTSGDAVLNGMSILSEQDAIRRLVGYCPQHGARVT